MPGRKFCSVLRGERASCGDFLQKSGKDGSLQRRLWLRKLIMGSGQDEEKKNSSRDDVIYKTAEAQLNDIIIPRCGCARQEAAAHWLLHTHAWKEAAAVQDLNHPLNRRFGCLLQLHV
ncbi:unnamed protein product [Ranitomeya imitator]|uniref:Uncharacterized protein n=1 Tax=Ranitomeya imitator TaxID=111125 RepID=A0ABN9LTD6_9NEOB|nr:unnamed protein product [Ranitomeya imitator]